MHCLAYLAALDDQCDLRPFAYSDQVMMHSRKGQQRRDRSQTLVYAPVAYDHVVVPLVHGPPGPKTQLLHGLLHAAAARAGLEKHR